jgi:hypothetical protein
MQGIQQQKLSVYVDASAPTITVSFYNGSNKLTPPPFNGYVYSQGTPTVAATVYGYELSKYATYTVNSGTSTPILGWQNLTTQAGSYLSVKATVTSGQKYSIMIKATDGINKLSNSNTTSATVVIGTGPLTVRATIPTTLPVIPTSPATDHYINYAASNTSYIATYTVAASSSGVPIKSAALLLNNGLSTVTVWSTNNTTNPKLTYIRGIVDLKPYTLSTSNGVTYTLTLVATDYANNTTEYSTKYYVDVVRPTIQPNKTLYKSGNTYYLDIGFGEAMQTLTSNSASKVTFTLANGLTYTMNPASSTYTPSIGLLHIGGLLTPSGSKVNVLPLAQNTVTITVGASYVDLANNPISNNGITVTFTNVSAPKPVNP